MVKEVRREREREKKNGGTHAGQKCLSSQDALAPTLDYSARAES